MNDSYIKVDSEKARMACFKTLEWIRKDREKSWAEVERHNNNIKNLPWYKMLFSSKLKGEMIKYHHWNKEQICNKICKCSLSSKEIYLSCRDAEEIELNNGN